jgi:putative FmdB family regulatory protein
MPIYEYRCNACGRRSQLFFRSFSAVGEARCQHCRSADVARLPSRVAYVRSESSYQEMMTDPSQLTDLDYENPRAVAEWAKRMGEATGADLGPEYDEMVEHIARGDDFDPAGLGADDYGGGLGGADDLGFGADDF